MLALIVRTTGDPMSAVPPLRRELRHVHSEVALVEPMVARRSE